MPRPWRRRAAISLITPYLLVGCASTRASAPAPKPMMSPTTRENVPSLDAPVSSGRAHESPADPGDESPALVTKAREPDPGKAINAPPSGEAIPRGADAAAPTMPDAYAEPISPEVIAAFPHLATYTGHIILGNERLQVVIAGVPAQPSPQIWQPAILALFARQSGPEPKWARVNGLSGMDVLGQLSGAGVYVPVGLDMDQDAGGASVTVVYTAPNQAPARLHYALGREATSLALRLNVPKPPAAPKVKHRRWGRRVPIPATDVPKPWQLRLRDFGGGRLFATDATYVEAYSGPDAVALAGLQPFTFNEHAADVLAGLSSNEDNACELLVGTAAAQALAYSHPSKGAAAVRLLALTLPADQDDEALGKRAYFLVDENNTPFAYLIAPIGETTTLALPRAAVGLVDVFSGQAVRQGKDRDETFALTPGKSLALTSTPGRPGRIHIVLPRQTQGSRRDLKAFVRVRSLVTPAALLAAASATGKSLAPGLYQVDAWPFEVRLPAGRYQVEVFNPRFGRFCSELAAVQSRKRSNIRCALPQSPLDFTASLSEAHDGDAALFGAKILGESGGEVPSLSVHDISLGLTLTLAPAAPSMRQSWQEFRQAESGNDMDVLAAFARRFAPTAILTLSCREDAVTPSDYGQLVQRLQPSAVQVYGCGSVERQEREVSQLESLGLTQPLLFTSAAAEDGLAHLGGYFPPRLDLAVVPSTVDENGLKALGAALRQGAYTLGSGVTLQLPQLRLVTRSAHFLSLSGELTWQDLPDVHAETVLVYSEQGLAARLEASAVSVPFSRKHKLPFVVRLPLNAQRVRFEVVGAGGILAMSNDLPLSSHPSPRLGSP